MGYALHSILVIAFTGHATGLSIRSYLSGVLGPMLACAPMFLATVSVARWLDQGSTPNFAKLAVEILAGAVVYVGAAYITARPAFLSMLKLIRNVIRRAPERQ